MRKTLSILLVLFSTLTLTSSSASAAPTQSHSIEAVAHTLAPSTAPATKFSNLPFSYAYLIDAYQSFTNDGTEFQDKDATYIWNAFEASYLTSYTFPQGIIPQDTPTTGYILSSNYPNVWHVFLLQQNVA